jgi:hypothetical protein
MSTLLLPGALAAWLVVCWWLARYICRQLVEGRFRPELQVIIFCALAPLALFDEMLGRAQFDEACRDKAVLTIHGAQAQGRSAYLSVLPPEPLTGLMLPVREQRWVYIDAETREPLLSFSVLRSQGGKLVRIFGWPPDAPPLTFEGYCAPTNRQSMIATLNLHLLPGTASATLGGP